MFKYLQLVAAVTLLLLTAPLKAQTAESVGRVAKVAGKVQVLRRPQATALDEAAVAAKRASQVKYDGRYWEAYELTEGSPLYFGDLLSASPEGKTQIQLDSGFNVVLASNAKLRLSRAIVANSPPKTVIDLTIGALRARAKAGIDEDGIEFRARTMALGVRGTDFSMTALPKSTEVVVVEGKIVVRNTLSRAGAEVFLTAGQATVVAVATEDLAALEQTMPAAEFDAMVAAYDPMPPAPATAAQMRQIRDFSEGVVAKGDQVAVESLLEKTTASEAAAGTPPEEPEDQRPATTQARRWLAVEATVGRRSVNTSGAPKLSVGGTEPRLAIDVAPFSWPLAFGLAYSRTVLGPSSEFDDVDFRTSRATEGALGIYARYTFVLNESHAFFGRAGVRNADLELEGRAPSDGSSRQARYSTGGLWLGGGYQWTFAPGFSLVAHLEIMPSSIQAQESLPADRDITRDPDGDEWGGGAVGTGLRYAL